MIKDATCTEGDSKTQRDSKGRYLKGSTGNAGGRIQKTKEKEFIKGMREFLEEKDSGKGTSKMRVLFENLYKASTGKNISYKAIEIMLRYALVLPKTVVEDITELDERYSTKLLLDAAGYLRDIFKDTPGHAELEEQYMEKLKERYYAERDQEGGGNG